MTEWSGHVVNVHKLHQKKNQYKSYFSLSLDLPTPKTIIVMHKQRLATNKMTLKWKISICSILLSLPNMEDERENAVDQKRMTVSRQKYFIHIHRRLFSTLRRKEYAINEHLCWRVLPRLPVLILFSSNLPTFSVEYRWLLERPYQTLVISEREKKTYISRR